MFFICASLLQIAAKRRGLCQETEVVAPEVPDVREDVGQAALRHAEPLRQGGPVLIHRGGWKKHAAGAGVARAAGGEQREVSVELAALHSRADDEVMIAPSVIAAIGA